MLVTWNILVIHFALPLFIFFSQPFPLFQSQQVLGVFGSEYRDYYNICVKKNENQSTEIVRLNSELSEAKTKLEDVDVYRESLEQRDEVLKGREDNLKNRQVAIDKREQVLEQRNFDFSKKLEEVSRQGGKAEQILANNEMLKIRVNNLEHKVDEERVSSKKDFNKEREFSKESLENERNINQGLLNRIDGMHRWMQLFEVIVGVIILLFVMGITFLYFNWRRERVEPQRIQTVDGIQTVDAKTLESKQNKEALPPS